ncbi:MAG: hypothetical protein AAGD11_13315 [Planctomycetota bacterium]
MNRVARSLLSLIALCQISSWCHGHGTPIFVSVNPSTGQLVADNGFDPGVLLPVTGGGFADSPGLAVTSQFVGLAFDEMIHVNVVQELMFWDGTNVVTATDTITIERPLGPGSSEVDTYVVDAFSGYQNGMLWGIFDSSPTWHADGLYVLESPTPQPGIYGVVLQLDSEIHVASEPFLLPLVYDPQATLGAVTVSKGIGDLQQAMVQLSHADFDRNTAVDAADLAVWQRGFGILGAARVVQGDATLDGVVSGSDFLAWQVEASDHAETPAATLAVPESSTLTLFLSLLFFAFIKGNRTSCAR